MRDRIGAWLLTLAGCGRIGFGPVAGDSMSGTTDDGSTLVDDAPPPVPGMIYIAEGMFVRGSDPGEGATDEEPEHVATLTRGYYIDMLEVTNLDYRACVTAAACTAPASADSRTRTGYHTNPLYSDYPVIHVTWSQARAYCMWAGKRLPTEAEWERAARGGCEVVAPATCGIEDERRWPWGNATPTCAQANIGNTMTAMYCIPGGDTDRVGNHSPAGDSPYGVRDLSANVWEWVEDYYAADYSWCAPACSDPSAPVGTDRVERGGGFLVDNLRVTTTFRANLPITDEYEDLGFRCAKSL